VVLWYGVLYLTRDGEPVCFVCALDDASDALDGTHELCELVRVQVGDARDGARRTHEHVYKEVQLAYCRLGRRSIMGHRMAWHGIVCGDMTKARGTYDRGRWV
jgi:hypothetical protein